jgi:hypothetical protein
MFVPSLSEQQTIQARDTNFALGTPYPTLEMNRPSSGFVPLGIGSCGAPGPSAYEYQNCWIGTPKEGEYLRVYAAAPKNNLEQGVLQVFTTTIDTGDFGPKQYYNTPTRSGQIGIANVNWPHMTVVGGSPDPRIPPINFYFNLETRTWEEPTQCQLFPIALSADLFEGVTNYFEVHEANYGIASRNFGWLTWDGSTITDTLVASLTPPGDNHLYTNPDDPSDHTVSIGDWVLDRPEVDGASSPEVERAMLDLAIGDDAYSTTTSYLAVTVPLWDQAVQQGESIRYHISGFAWISVDRYRLDQPNHLSIYYGGRTTCPNAP